MLKLIAIVLCGILCCNVMAETVFPAGKYEISEQGRKNAQFMQESAMFYYYIKQKKMKSAAEYYEKILDKKPESAYLLYWGVRLFEDKHLPEEKLISIAKRHPESPLMCSTFASTLFAAGKKDTAFEIMEKSFSYFLEPPEKNAEPRGKKSGEMPENFQSLLRSYLELVDKEEQYQKGNAKLEKVFQVFPAKKLEDQTLIALIEYILKAEQKLKSGAGKKKAEPYITALKQLLESPNEFHQEIGGYFIILLLSENENELARALLTESLLTNPVSPTAYRNLYLMNITKNNKHGMLRAISHEVLYSTLKDKRIPRKRFAEMFEIALEAKADKVISKQAGRMIQMGLLNDKICAKAVLYYFEKNDFTSARDYLERMRNNHPMKDAFKAMILERGKKYREALRLYMSMEQRFPAEPLYKMGAAEAAKKAGEKEIELQFRNEMLMKIDKYPEFQNYIGYTWAEQGINLDRAEKYLESALKSDPKSYAYLDSMAWIAYKKKNYKKAEKYINLALSYCTSEQGKGVLYDHAGDIYSALGNRRKALQHWQLAVRSNDPELNKDAVMRKLPRPRAVGISKAQNPISGAGDRKIAPAVPQNASH